MTRARSAFPRTLEKPVPQYIDEYLRRQDHVERSEYRISQFWGDLGIVRLGTNDFVGALDAFLHSGHWRDAAYVAEQLLSREELLVYVRNRWPNPLESFEGDEYGPNRVGDMRRRIRYLAARRLARDLYFKDARGLYPPPLIPIFDRYVEHYRTFRDRSRSKEERADHGWRAAQIHRRLGMELFGTEVAPDWGCFGGHFNLSDGYIISRLGVDPDSRIAARPVNYRNPNNNDDEIPYWNETDRVEIPRPIVLPSGAELWRFRNYGKLANVYRFHYRHVAADLAWEAAELMPNNSPETVEVLCIAGTWLKDRYPKPADTFYKAMIWRNWSTPLARKADEKRWFPEVSWEFDAWESEGLKRPERYWQLRL